MDSHKSSGSSDVHNKNGADDSAEIYCICRSSDVTRFMMYV
jgi:hypothetical protein